MSRAADVHSSDCHVFRMAPEIQCASPATLDNSSSFVVDHSQLSVRSMPLTVATSRSAGATSTSGISLSLNCALTRASRAAVAIPGHLKLLKQVAYPAARPASSVRSCERALHSENPSLRRNRGRPASVQSRRPFRADPLYIMTPASSSDDRSAGLSPEAAFAISSTVKNAPSTIDERRGTPAARTPVLLRGPEGAARGSGHFNSIPEPRLSRRTSRFGHCGSTRSRRPPSSCRPTPGARNARQGNRRARLPRGRR